MAWALELVLRLQQQGQVLTRLRIPLFTSSKAECQRAVHRVTLPPTDLKVHTHRVPWHDATQVCAHGVDAVLLDAGSAGVGHQVGGVSLRVVVMVG